MRDRFSIIGFTEAELGFIAAILLFAATLTTKPHPVSKPTPIVSAAEFNQMKLRLAELTRLNAEEIKKNVELQREVDELQNKHLRSKQKPTCIEKKVATGFVAYIEVEGSDEFKKDGEVYDLEALLDQLSPQLTIAQEAGCVQSIHITPVAGLSADEYVRARTALARYFNPSN
jgi:hypothetical protein